MSQDNNATLVITDINAALGSAEKEASQKPACFLVMGGEINGTLFDLVEGESSFGRGAENLVCLEFNGISRAHLKVIVNALTVTLFDLNSTNGTFINNVKVIEPVLLRKGDIIKMGAISMKFIPKGDPERLTYDKLHLDATTDGLTRCYNKKYFNDNCELEVKKSKVTGAPLSLIVFDLDHFKKLNDTYGHDAGDFVLKTMAQVIRQGGVRENDILARYGGEEFVILLPKTNIKQGFEIAERLRKLIETYHFIYDQKRLPVTASIGVSDYRPGVENGTELFKRADQAVYKSKQGGRNQVNYFRPE